MSCEHRTIGQCEVCLQNAVRAELADAAMNIELRNRLEATAREKYPDLEPDDVGWFERVNYSDHERAPVAASKALAEIDKLLVGDSSE